MKGSDRTVEINGSIVSVDDYRWEERPSPKTIELMRQALLAFEDLADFLPASLRQVYYRMVGRGFVRNHVNEYRKIMRLLKNARRAGMIPWEWMEDRTRQAYLPRVFRDTKSYTQAELHWFLNDFQRDLLQSQDRAVLLCSEKDALREVFQQAAAPYRVGLWVVKGFSSAAYVKELAKWIKNERRTTGRPTVIVYAGDHDPSGLDIPRSVEESLRNHHGVKHFRMERVGLTYSQVRDFDLPTDPEAVKPKDPRRRSYIDALLDLGDDVLQGELEPEPEDLVADRDKDQDDRMELPAWELDALAPEDLAGLLGSELEKHVDPDRVAEQQEREESDLAQLAKLKAEVEEFVADKIRELD